MIAYLKDLREVRRGEWEIDRDREPRLGDRMGERERRSMVESDLRSGEREYGRLETRGERERLRGEREPERLKGGGERERRERGERER